MLAAQLFSQRADTGYGYFHNQMGLPWSPAPGFTCQLWWIFSFHLRCSRLLGQRWRRDGGKMGRGVRACEGEEREVIRPLLFSTSWINHRIIYLWARSARAPALLCLPQIKARFPHINNKLSLAFLLWAIKCHHIHTNNQVGWVAKIS